MFLLGSGPAPEGVSVLLKIAMFCIIGLVVGTGHYWLVGPPNQAPLAGLLAGLGGVAYIELFLHARR
jgi:hypothetical protein